MSADDAEAAGGTPRAASAKRKMPPEHDSVGEREAMQKLWKLYIEAVVPLEKKSFYEHFELPPLTVKEFGSRPHVLLLGQYSTGKTSMIQWLVGKESAHFDVRPQPSTDKFMAVVHGDDERLIHGNAAACLPQLPYQGLSMFGGSFLGNFTALAMPADILKQITFVDTPGVLSGSKQRIGRPYDFPKVAAWMAERADLVLLTFDAHKLDISDEFQEVMEVLRPHATKVRCVLNKADQVDHTNLVRVYGALLWNVGKILRTPEVAPVFVSSFWEEGYRHKEHKALFDEDKEALMKEMYALPRNSLLRKINEFVARVRKVKAHMIIITYIKSKLPWFPAMVGASGRLLKWIDQNLTKLFEDAQRLRGLSPGDMPDIDAFRRQLANFEDVTQLPTYDAKDMKRLDHVIDVEVPLIIGDVGGVSMAPAHCIEATVGSPEHGGFFANMMGGKRRRAE